MLRLYRSGGFEAMEVEEDDLPKASYVTLRDYSPQPHKRFKRMTAS